MISEKHDAELIDLKNGDVKINLFNIVQIVIKLAVILYDILTDLRNQKVHLDQNDQYIAELNTQLEFYKKQFEATNKKNGKAK